MASHDFIPAPNAEFAAWEINFVNQVNTFKAVLGTPTKVFRVVIS